MPPQQPSTMSQKATAAAFWGFKAFLSMGTFPVTGGLEVLVTLGTQLLVEGVSAVARRAHKALGPSTSSNTDNSSNSNHYHEDTTHNHDTYHGAVDSMVRAYGSVERFQREVTTFAQFSGQISRQLALRGDATGGDAMATAERVYLQFVECDLDGSGDISIEEFVIFCSKMDVSEESALATFFRADVNGDGKISFEEWTAMMMGRVGRAESGVNCGGRHGLTRYTARIPGISCDFCDKFIPVGSLATGCRRCNCDACSSCSGLPEVRSGAPPPPFGDSARPTLALPSAGAAKGLNCRCSRGLDPFVTRCDTHCTWCRTLLPAGNPAVGCWACDANGCMDCVSDSLEARCASALNCRGRHGLAKTRILSQGYMCDFCRTVLAGGTTIYGCRTCEVTACVTCVWKDHRRALSSPSGAFSCPRNHQLRTMPIFGYPQLGHNCKWCLKAPSLHDHILRCHVCDVNVCGACQASGAGQRAPPAPAATPLLPPPPPSYGEFISKYNKSNPQDGAPSPPPLVTSSNAGSAHAYAPNSPGFPELKQRAIPVAESLFPFDSVVRVLSVEGDDPHGKVMAPAPAATPLLPPPPPSYGEFISKYNKSSPQDGAPSPPPLVSPSNAGSAHAYAPNSPGFPELKQRAIVVAESPFPFDSVVRVLSVEEDDPHGKVMTVIGFEPSGGCAGGDGDGEVVLNFRGQVVRAPSFLVSKLDEIM